MLIKKDTLNNLNKENEFISNSSNSEKNNSHKKSNQKGSEKIIKFLFYTIILLMFFIFLGMFIVVLNTTPLINQEKSLPKNFPIEIPDYLLQKAIIKTQNQIQQQQTINLIESLPNWFITLFINKISTDSKTQILLINQKEKIYDANSLKNSLKTTINYSKIISLKWKNIDKTKEDLIDYYIKKLKLSDFFIITENRGEEVLIIFTKSDLKGVILITDNFKNSNSSKVTITIAY